ncbi:MAG TPA: NAD(P)/FAD-dependent oxidoreductase [Alphaproteobacteria bacterium]
MKYDIVIIGAGAAGLMCAIEAGKRQRRVLLVEHTDKIGEKIRISGGGRCNFTNINAEPKKYLSKNAHYCTSALKRFTQWDFIELVKKHRIKFHEKTLGQLFCDETAKDIINMLLAECRAAEVTIKKETKVDKIWKEDNGSFTLQTSLGEVICQSVVIATGGPPIPKIGATEFGYKIARQFGINVIPHRAGLVPLTFEPDLLDYTKELSGVAIDPIHVTSESGMLFREAMLFTHRGISGPAILQISSYWNPGESITLNLLPDIDLMQWLTEKRQSQPRAMLHTLMHELLPKRLVQKLVDDAQLSQARIADLSDKILQNFSSRIVAWQVTPSGSEGYRTAEVALGGVDTHALSSKTMEARDVPGLYFIGEVVDVTGHLGGYNFQWAWSSGWCAGQYA